MFVKVMKSMNELNCKRQSPACKSPMIISRIWKGLLFMTYLMFFLCDFTFFSPALSEMNFRFFALPVSRGVDILKIAHCEDETGTSENIALIRLT